MMNILCLCAQFLVFDHSTDIFILVEIVNNCFEKHASLYICSVVNLNTIRVTNYFVYPEEMEKDKSAEMS